MRHIKKQLTNHLTKLRSSVKCVDLDVKVKMITLLEMRDNYKVIIKSIRQWMSDMRSLHEVYWSWLNSQNKKFRYRDFINICKSAWCDVSQLGFYVSFYALYRHYRKLEKKIPRSYGIVRSADNPHKILLVRHHTGSLWSLPGGKLEHGESYGKAFCRELYEETGINNKHHISLLSKKFVRNNKMCYNTLLEEGEIYLQPINKYEIAEVKWFDLHKMPPMTSLLKNSLYTHDIYYNFAAALP